MPLFLEPNLTDNLALVTRFNAVVRSVGATPAQLAIGWVIARRTFIVALPSTRNAAHLDQNIAAATIDFSADRLAAVDAIFTPKAMAGYQPVVQEQIDTEPFSKESL